MYNLQLIIPILIIIAFSSKGLSLYFARINIIRVGEEVAGELQKKIATNIEKGIFNFSIRKAGKMKVVKKWDNEYFVLIYINK